ncbi:MotA/TolQ/ExbB proton channel family protein [Stieleria varia]
MSFLLPLAALGLGMIWVMMSLPDANAQYPQRFPQNNGGFQNNNFQNGQNFGGMQPAQSQPAFRQAARDQYQSSIPAAPTTATDTLGGEATEAATTDEADAGASWMSRMPSFVQKLASGGWLMLPLGVCSLIVFALSLERMISLRRGRVIPRPFVRRFTECVEDGQLSYEEATELCKEFDCPVSEVFRAALRRWGRPMFEIEQAVMDAGDRVSDSLKRFLRVFHAISNVAPLLGLLGTVIGMIQAFEVISDSQSLGRPDMLASGISTALMTTAGGLMVAIPAYLAYMYFSSKSDRYLGEIEKLCQRVVDCISAESLEDGGGKARKRRAA